VISHTFVKKCTAFYNSVGVSIICMVTAVRVVAMPTVQQTTISICTWSLIHEPACVLPPSCVCTPLVIEMFTTKEGFIALH